MIGESWMPLMVALRIDCDNKRRKYLLSRPPVAHDHCAQWGKLENIDTGC